MGADDEELIEDTLTSPSAPSSGPSGPAVATELLGRYALLNPIGEGGGGRVYRAFDRDLERNVAIKVLKRAGKTSSILSTRLRREAQASAHLQHPNVVSVFDVGDHDGEVFIAMEYVDGGPLADWLRAPRTRTEVLDACLQAGRGLLAAHEKGIIHRDFKPSNILVGTDGRVRVADFGLARGMSAETNDDSIDEPRPPSPGLVDHPLTKTGAVVGTPAYMAPEQFSGRRVDARADQFSFCLVVAEALTGTKAPRGTLTAKGWRSEDMNASAWLRGQRLPSRLREPLIKGLSADPEDRFVSLRPILDVLRVELGRGRQWGAAGATIAVAALASAAVVLIITWPAPPCVDLDQPWTQVWNARQRDRLTKHLASATAGGRQEIAGAIERYGTRWTGARAEVCAATHVRGEQSDQLLDVRMACLNRALEGVKRVLALVEADRLTGVGPLSEAILRMRDPATCRTTENAPRWLAPADPEAAKAAARAEKTLAELEALVAGGFTKAGVREAQVALSHAERSGHKPTLAAASEQLGKMLQANDRFEEARSAYARAELLSEEIGDDERRLSTLIALIRLDQGTPEHAPATDRNVARANAVLARQGGTALQSARLRAAMSQLSIRRGDLIACRTHGEAAMRHLNNAPEPPLSVRLALSTDLARCLERLGRRRDAAAVLQHTLTTAEGRLGATHPRVGRLNIQLSRALDFSGNRPGARRAAERAVDISVRTLGHRHSQTAEAFQALANVMFREGDFEGSRVHLGRAIDVFSRVYGPRSHQAAGLTSSLGLTLSRLGRFDEAHRAHQRAVDLLSETIGPQHPITAAAIGRMGSNLRARGDCEAAIGHCRDAMKRLEERDPEHGRILDQIRCVAGCLVKLERHREAIAPLQRGLTLSQIRDEPADYTARLELLGAEAFWATQRRRRATALAESALRRLESSPEHAALKRKVAAWLDAHRIAQ